MTCCSSTADEIHDFDLIAVAHLSGFECGALEYHLIVLDGHAPRIDLEIVEKRRHCPRARKLVGIAVEQYIQGRASRNASTKLPTGKSDCILTGSRRAS